MSYLGTVPRAVSINTMTKPTIANTLRRYRRREGARVYNWYNENHPLLTRGLTGGLLALAGDAVAQWSGIRLASQREDAKGESADYSKVPAYDKQRGAAFFIYSVWYNAYPWNRYLEFTMNPANTYLTTPVRRAVVTTCLFNPLFYLPTFYVGYGLLNFQSAETMKMKMTTEYPEAVRQILMVYAPIYALQFTVIPPSLQVAYSSVANFCWCVMLSSMAAADSVVNEETHKFERFDSSAITVENIVEKAKDLPSELSMNLDSATIDKVFHQLKSSQTPTANHGGPGHKTKAVECEEHELQETGKSTAACSISLEDKSAEEDFGRLVRLLQDDRFKFFSKVELRTPLEG